VIPGPTEFLMGSATRNPAAGDDEQRHSQWIQGFCIASKETTVEQFRAFLAAAPAWTARTPETVPETPGQPVTNVSWFEATAYCNWLSEQEGIPRDQWCYQPNSQGRYAAGMRAARNALQLKGYRLPTEAEWEYACRAGAESERCFGNHTWHLPKYAACVESGAKPLPVGGRKPNDLGLFDMHGNAAEWCHNGYQTYPRGSALPASLDREGGLPIHDDHLRVVRGGSYRDAADHIRSAARDKQPPSARLATIGFRVARSYP